MTADHDEWRRRITEAATDIIAREGLAAATIRRIATELGFSTTVITHYFADKQELLHWTYRALAKQGEDRFEEVFAANPTDTIGGLLTMTAHSPSTLRRWRAYLAFWDQAASDPVFSAENHQATEYGLTSIARLIRARYGDHVDVAKIARLLNAICQGLSLQALVNPHSVSAEQTRMTLTEAVELVLGPQQADAEYNTRFRKQSV